LSDNGLEGTLVSVLFSLERKYPCLSKNLFSLGQKATRLNKNGSESTLLFLQRAHSGELYSAQVKLAE